MFLGLELGKCESKLYLKCKVSFLVCENKSQTRKLQRILKQIIGMKKFPCTYIGLYRKGNVNMQLLFI